MHSLFLFQVSAFFKSQMFLLPVLYLFYLSNGLTAADYFLFQGIVILINVLLQIPMGYLGDRLSRKGLVLFSYLLFLGRIGLWFCFQGGAVVLAGELLGAVSKAIFDAVEAPYVHDLVKQGKRTGRMVNAYAGLNAALSAGTGLAALAGAWLYESGGFQILLATEFICVSVAVGLALRLPDVSKRQDVGIRLWSGSVSARRLIRNLIRPFRMVLKDRRYRSFIIYSAIAVACSHFFFWSFQPLMTAAEVPVVLFGAVVFGNNLMRFIGSLGAGWVMKRLSLKNVAIFSFGMNTIGLLGVFGISRLGYVSSGGCLGVIFYLCCCITCQLIFTIAQISRLQETVPTVIRTRAAAGNMMIARLFAATVLIIPKYGVDMVSLPTLFGVYGILFTGVGGFILCDLLRSPVFVKQRHGFDTLE